MSPRLRRCRPSASSFLWCPVGLLLAAASPPAVLALDGLVEETRLYGDGADRFGGSGKPVFHSCVAVEEDTIAVGAPYASDIDAERGAVYVYERVGGDWELQTRVDGILPGSHFGSSLDLDGDDLIVGTRWSGNDFAHVFTRSGGTWTRQANLPGRNSISTTWGSTGDGRPSALATRRRTERARSWSTSARG